MGRGPTETRAQLLPDLVLVRLRGVLTPAEQKLVTSEEGRRLVKRMRMELIEGASELLAAVISGILGRPVTGMHTDISTTTGERVILFVLEESGAASDPRTRA